MCLAAHDTELPGGPLKCQTSTVSPAEPGDFPLLVNATEPPSAGASGSPSIDPLPSIPLQQFIGLLGPPRADGVVRE